MVFFTTVVKEFLHSCVFGYKWHDWCGFGLCRFLPDLKRCTTEGPGVFWNFDWFLKKNLVSLRRGIEVPGYDLSKMKNDLC